jgi:hypothetical protein
VANGNLVFSTIKQLPDNWWNSPPPDDPSSVWSVWDQNTYYLWGANAGNYQGIEIGQSLNGAGMAGTNGPTLGRAHPHYVGIITMNQDDMPKNDAVFSALSNLLKNGRNVVIPTYHGQFSLGTGIACSQSGWRQIQIYLLTQIVKLGQDATTVQIPSGTFWPDCRKSKPYPQYPIARLDDLKDIVKTVLSASGDLS